MKRCVTSLVIKKMKMRGAWVAQSLSICLQLRVWSRSPGIESHIRLLRCRPASPSHTPLACVQSLTIALCQIN